MDDDLVYDVPPWRSEEDTMEPVRASDLYRLLPGRSLDVREKEMLDYLKVIWDTSAVLGLPDNVKEKAARLVERYIDRRARAREARKTAVAVAALWLAAVDSGWNVSLATVAEAAGLPRRRFGWVRRAVLEISSVSRDILSSPRQRAAMRVNNTLTVLSHVVRDSRVIEEAARIAGLAVERGIAEVNPEAAAAAAVVIARHRVTGRYALRDVAAWAGVTAKTVNVWVKRLRGLMGGEDRTERRGLA